MSSSSEIIRTKAVRLMKTTSETKQQILALMEETFVDDEFWCTVWKNNHLRHDVAPCLFHIRLEHDLIYSHVLVKKGEPQILGHLVVKPTRTSSATVVSLLPLLFTSGMLWKVFYWGYRSTIGRILTCKQELEQDMNQTSLIGDVSKTWTIEQVAIHAAYRGKGYGRIMMEQCLKTVVPPGQRVVLHTQNKSNVRFYEKVGFTIAEHKIVRFLGETRDNWCMHIYT